MAGKPRTTTKTKAGPEPAPRPDDVVAAKELAALIDADPELAALRDLVSQYDATTSGGRLVKAAASRLAGVKVAELDRRLAAARARLAEMGWGPG